MFGKRGAMVDGDGKTIEGSAVCEMWDRDGEIQQLKAFKT
jgi:hypothetical protein